MKVTSPNPTTEDLEIAFALRPKRLFEFVGHNEIIERLRVFIEATKERGEPLDHTLFYGPPGLGKTTLAYIIANELSVGFKSTSGPVLERKGDLAAILTNLSDGDVLFIDEIHRMNRWVEELLYQAMEEYKLDIIIGKGPNARCIKLDLPKFTLVGATTRAGLLTSPLRDRFGIVNRLGFYSEEDMLRIVKRSAKILKIPLTHGGALELAKRSRGTPRIANRLLRRIRDFAQVEGEGVITSRIAQTALSKLEIDELGLDSMDRKILETLVEKFNGGPVGIKTLTVAVEEEVITIEELYEPYLIKVGFINRTPRGRFATPLAYEYLRGKRKE